MAWGKEWAGTDSGKAFLGAFKDDFKNRQARTDAAQGKGSSGSGGININTGSKSGSSGMTKLAPDIHLQPGTKTADWTMPGVQGKKGFAGTAIRGLGLALAPATGGLSTVAANVGAEASGADYW